MSDTIRTTNSNSSRPRRSTPPPQHTHTHTHRHRYTSSFPFSFSVGLSSVYNYPHFQSLSLQFLLSSAYIQMHVKPSPLSFKPFPKHPKSIPKMPSPLFLFFLISLLQLSIAAAAPPSLRRRFYSKTCPNAQLIVRNVMRNAMIREPRSGASVMRLQFHDCFVDGCDGSLLLDDTPTMLGEKLSLSNINSLRSYEVVDEIKEALEKECPGIVSCADIIIMASRDAVLLSGGPSWEVKLGRQDSLTASQEHSDNIMPSPRANASSLIDLFSKFNLSVKDLVALSGSHSIGKGRCFSIMFRLYNQSGSGQPDPTIEPGFRENLNKICPLDVDQNVTVNLDATPEVFDNQYFIDLVNGKGFLNSDETLFTFSETREFVKKYSVDQNEFFKDFVEGMIKMGDLQIDQPGEIRRNCRVVNGGKGVAGGGLLVGGSRDRKIMSLLGPIG